MNDPAIAATWLMPSANPRWRGGKASVRIAVLLAKRKPAPTPCTSRKTIGVVAATLAGPNHEEPEETTKGEDRKAEIIEAYAPKNVGDTAEGDQQRRGHHTIAKQ